ncbi:bactofilin family protein [Thermovibrio sp.]
MLKRKDEKDTGEIKSILSPELKVEGNIYAQGKIRIDGTVEGNVEGEFLIFGQTAKVKGNVKAEKVVIMGSIVGDVIAEEAHIKGSTKLKGNIEVKELTVEKGASIEGNFRCGEFTKGEVQSNSRERNSQ